MAAPTRRGSEWITPGDGAVPCSTLKEGGVKRDIEVVEIFRFVRYVAVQMALKMPQALARTLPKEPTTTNQACASPKCTYRSRTIDVEMQEMIDDGMWEQSSSLKNRWSRR